MITDHVDSSKADLSLHLLDIFSPHLDKSNANAKVSHTRGVILDGCWTGQYTRLMSLHVKPMSVALFSGGTIEDVHSSAVIYALFSNFGTLRPAFQGMRLLGEMGLVKRGARVWV